jgi:hypothetical protein
MRAAETSHVRQRNDSHRTRSVAVFLIEHRGRLRNVPFVFGGENAGAETFEEAVHFAPAR